ncbi:protease [Streptomyces pyxinae]|uniref:protease n=1 Tax=Streptomyces pyxinae TaxID=2970734 RepID=UPI003D17DAFF
MNKLLLSLHVVAAILAVGPVAVAASMFPAALRRAGEDPGASATTLRLLHRICRVYAYLGLAVPLLGLATASGMGVLGDTWLIVSMALTALAAALLAFRILPAQALALATAGAPGAEAAGAPGAGGGEGAATVAGGAEGAVAGGAASAGSPGPASSGPADPGPGSPGRASLGPGSPGPAAADEAPGSAEAPDRRRTASPGPGSPGRADPGPGSLGSASPVATPAADEAPGRLAASRLAMLTGVFNLLWAAVTVLMIVRPGSTTGA